MRGRILIIGAGEYQVPAILKAKQAGYFVLATDIDQQAPGFIFADLTDIIDIKDRQSNLDYARKHAIDGVISICVDYAAPTVAYIAENMGLVGPSYDSAMNCRSKSLARDALSAAGVPGPGYIKYKYGGKLPEKIGFGYPVVVKPADSTGSKGVVLVKNPDELPGAIDAANGVPGSTGEILIEEYMQGPEVSVEGLVYKGVTTIVAVTDKIVSPPPFFVETGHTIPTSLEPTEVACVKDFSANILKLLKVDYAAFHIEIKVTSKGPMLVEIGCRLAGGTIATDLVPIATGVDLVGEVVRMAMGETPRVEPAWEKAAAVRFFTPPSGRIERISHIEDARRVKGVKNINLKIGVGGVVRPMRSSLDRVGYVISEGNTRDDAVVACEQAIDIIEFRVSR